MKRILSLFAFSIITTLSFAYDVCVEDVYYNVDVQSKTASVTYKDKDFNSYSGEVKIAKKVEHEGVKCEVTSIGDSAFYQCKDLTSIVINKNITDIGNGAFNACTGLTAIDIPKSVTSIGNYAFYACSGLTAIKIHKTVTSIGIGAFAGCTALAELEIDKGNLNFRVEDGILYDKEKTHLLSCLGTKSGAYVAPSTVVKIDNAAFSGCAQVTSVDVPNTIESVGDSLFMGCTSITTLRIPYTVGSIGACAFANSGMTSIEIPKTVRSIGDNAFGNCEKLALVIMHSATKKGMNLFANCPTFDLIEIGDPANMMIVNGLHYDVNFDTKEATVVKSGKPYSGKVAIPEMFSFRDVQYRITAIAAGAFKDCTKLTSITVPRFVKSVGEGAFEGCEALTAVHISDIAAWCEMDFKQENSEDALVANPLLYAKKLYLNGKLVQELVIPESVTKIGVTAFMNCADITSVTIPNTVTSIGANAFSGCTGLTSFSIPNSIKAIEDGTFFYCTNLASVDIPTSVERIGKLAFKDCEKLTSVTIPNSVKRIGGGAFNGCKGLTNIVIPEPITRIEEGTFYSCSNLTSITIPDGVTTIGNNAFQDCYNLIDVQLPKFLRNIGDYAFDGCRSLSSDMDIPIFASIGDHAFPYNIHKNPTPEITRTFFGLTLGESSKQETIQTLLEKRVNMTVNTKNTLYAENVTYDGRTFDRMTMNFYKGALSSVYLSDVHGDKQMFSSSKKKELVDYYTKKHPSCRYYVLFGLQSLFDDDVTKLLILDGSLVFTDAELSDQASKAEADRYREIHPFTDKRISKEVLGCTLGKSTRQHVVDTLKTMGLQIVEDFSPDSIAFSGITHEGIAFGRVTANFFEGRLMALTFNNPGKQLSRSERSALEEHFVPMYAAYDMRNGMVDTSVDEGAVSYLDDAVKLSISPYGLGYIDCVLQDKWGKFVMRSLRGKHEVGPGMQYIVDMFNKMEEEDRARSR